MSRSSGVRVTGPLVPFADGFWEELAGRGYSPLSARNQLRLLAHVSRWMAAEGVAVEGLTSDRIAEFVVHRRGVGYTGFVSERALGPLLGFLRAAGVVPEPLLVVREGRFEEVLDGYRRYLVEERALAAVTVRRRDKTARWFLAECVGDGRIEEMTGADVQGFVLAECPWRSVGLAKNIVSELRSLLRFLFLAGQLPRDLSRAAPAVAGWRGASLPKAVDPALVAALITGCDQGSRVGRRDRAILVLLSRLGLRAGEVAALTLEDVDWWAGELVVRGKGDREERLPLPVDVGEAMVAYLCDGRPVSEHRGLLLGARAPFAPMTSAGIKAVVRQACVRAGVDSISAHQLRHTAATEMLNAGATLGEVGQVLRHRSAATTAIYAKVHTDALRDLALPWPGAAR